MEDAPKLEEGLVIAIEISDGWSGKKPCLIRLSKHDGWRGEKRGWWKAETVAHVAPDGEIAQEGTPIDAEIPPEDFDEYYVPALVDPPEAIVKVTADVDEDGDVWYKGKGGKADGAVHHKDEDGGGTLCGTTLSYEEDKGRRWDPWLKMWKPPKSEASVFLPSFQEVTCKRCLKKQA